MEDFPLLLSVFDALAPVLVLDEAVGEVEGHVQLAHEVTLEELGLREDRLALSGQLLTLEVGSTFPSKLALRLLTLKPRIIVRHYFAIPFIVTKRSQLGESSSKLGLRAVIVLNLDVRIIIL